jgi:peptidoglycan/LPS O-acetylase OafA/YrhL
MSSPSPHEDMDQRLPSMIQVNKLKSEKTEIGAMQKLMSFSSLNALNDMLKGDTKSWDEGKNELDVFNAIKFFQIFLILITCTAMYLILAAPTNPWIMAVFFDNITFTMVIAGIIAIDSFFTYSAFFAFYRISQIYDAKLAMGASGFGVIDLLKIYTKRLLRLLPLFYLTFLVGMFLIPRVSSGGIWYTLEQALFFECDKYWWASFLLISNFVPWDQNAKGGCMPWGWAIAVDFQLYLLIPLYVVIYKKSRTAALTLCWGLLIAGTAIICTVVSEFNLTAGAYTLENWYMYAQYLNKPYCKLQVHAIGILFAILYFDLIEYRRIKQRNEEIAKAEFPKVHFISTNYWVGKLILYAGLTMIITNLFISYGCTKTPYAWSNVGNMVYFSLTRFCYSLGWICIAFYIILGHTKVGKVLLASAAFNGCGRLVYPAYLISPIIMMVVYCNTDHGVMMTLLCNVTLGMGHLTLSFIIGAIIYIMIQWPIKRAIQLTLYPFVTHEDLIKVHHKKMGEGNYLQ